MDESNRSRSRVKLINIVLITVITLHGLLLISLELVDYKDQMLKAVTFIHYYPMAIAIIMCFVWIYWQLHRYIEFMCRQEETSAKQAE